MLVKIVKVITIVIPLFKGIKKIWSVPETSTIKKIAATLTIVIPILVGIADVFKNEKKDI